MMQEKMEKMSSEELNKYHLSDEYFADYKKELKKLNKQGLFCFIHSFEKYEKELLEKEKELLEFARERLKNFIK